MSRLLPSTRELMIALLAVLLTMATANLVQRAEAGAGGPTTDTVYVATGENFPDALGAAAAAGALLAPVLLVTPTSVPQPTLDELNRLAPEQIVIVGGTAVISNGVQTTLEGLAFAPTVTRESGTNRYATAAALSAATFPTSGFYPLAAHSGGEGTDSGIGTTDVVVESVTLSAPVDGTIIVNSTTNANYSTANAFVRCSITTGTTWDGAYLQAWESPGATGGYSQIAGTRGFDVAAGDFTANLVCDVSGAGTATLYDSTLTAIFVANI